MDAGWSGLSLEINTMSVSGTMYAAQQAIQVPGYCYTTEDWTYMGYLDPCYSPEMLDGSDYTPSAASSPSATLSTRSHSPEYRTSPSAHTGNQPEQLSDKNKWAGGILEKHWDSRLTCCGKTYRCSYTLKRHKQETCKYGAKAPRLFKCDRCKRVFTRKSNLGQHLREVEHLTMEQAKYETKTRYP